MLFIYGEACAVLLPMERGVRMDVFWCLDYNLIKRGLEKEGASVMSSYTGRKMNALLCASALSLSERMEKTEVL